MLVVRLGRSLPLLRRRKRVAKFVNCFLSHASAAGPHPEGSPIVTPRRIESSVGPVSPPASAYDTGSPYAKLAEHLWLHSHLSRESLRIQMQGREPEATLTHNGGGNSNSIANMAAWTKKQYKVDCIKVFVTGSSSRRHDDATYPELFAAGIAYSGVPTGCFMSATDQVQAWNSTCSQGKSIATPEAMYPGYNGPRPKMQIYHGSADTALLPPSYNETCKQWAGVFGYKYDAPKSVVQNTPEAKYETTTWGDKLQGIYATGVGRTVPIHGERDMMSFGFAR
ncbi:acetyl xylan esterase [Aspergillus novofumigatus IBT 16806]|uniref:Uncharacterized protein n=1 Tax=Aspergillus novofumigatus (strain IBT 16806) TaxID=1392255 RepID=A0A2I1CMB3_ASPN1|nr:uncharacterized protein P174DRAFT_508952 [Aspergillus novofumigatus IBT 16806]PKX98759.1 hypothetical protein P174DRAFT_508952 [Aspergillus novofumigatus IBT 16806]